MMTEWLKISSKRTKIGLPNDLPNQCTDLPGSCFSRHARVSISSTCSHHHLHCHCSMFGFREYIHIYIYTWYKDAVTHNGFVGIQKPTGRVLSFPAMDSYWIHSTKLLRTFLVFAHVFTSYQLALKILLGPKRKCLSSNHRFSGAFVVRLPGGICSTESC